jgi:hypothetical protein
MLSVVRWMSGGGEIGCPESRRWWSGQVHPLIAEN